MMFEMHKNILCESKNGKFKDEMGNSFWYLNGKLHREDGPAVEGPDGRKVWFINGERHREDGPAVDRRDGTNAWYLNGVKYSEEEFNNWLAKKQLTEKLSEQLDLKPTGKKMKI